MKPRVGIHDAVVRQESAKGQAPPKVWPVMQAMVGYG